MQKSPPVITDPERRGLWSPESLALEPEALVSFSGAQTKTISDLKTFLVTEQF